MLSTVLFLNVKVGAWHCPSFPDYENPWIPSCCDSVHEVEKFETKIVGGELKRSVRNSRKVKQVKVNGKAQRELGEEEEFTGENCTFLTLASISIPISFQYHSNSPSSHILQKFGIDERE